MRRALVVAAAAFLLGAVPANGAAPTAPLYDAAGRLVETPFAPSDAPPALTEDEGGRHVPGLPEGRALARPLPARPPDRRVLRPAHAHVDRAGLVRRGRRDRDGHRRRCRRPGARGVDRAAGRLEDGPRPAGRVRRQARSPPGRCGSGSRPSSSWGWSTSGGPSRCGPSTCSCCSRSGSRSRSSIAASVFESAALAVPPLVYLARTNRVDRLPGDLAAGLDGRQLARLGARGRHPLPRRLPRRVERRQRAHRHRRRLRRRDRRGQDSRRRACPYGTMPVTDDRTPCGPANADGEVRDRIQANGRCESANPRGDTYGPVAYLAYVPAVLAFGWSGRWDALPAAHAAAIAFDLLALAGLAVVGARFGGAPPRGDALLRLGGVSLHDLRADVQHQRRDRAGHPRLGLLARVVAGRTGHRDRARVVDEVRGADRRAALAHVPVGPPARAERRGSSPRSRAATLLAFSILLLDPSLRDALHTFWDRTLAFQLDRDSPFSIWGWGSYHARGIPDLASLQTVVQVCAIVLAGVAAAVPRRQGPARAGGPRRRPFCSRSSSR